MRSASKNKLRQRMSEVLSLREKVAQAELRARDQAAEEWLPRGRPSDRASQSRHGQD
jgi:hypothetical protein